MPTAPSDAVDVGLQRSYDTLKSVPVHQAGPRTIDSDHNQTPKVGKDASGYSSGGSPLNQGHPKGDSNYIGD